VAWLIGRTPARQIFTAKFLPDFYSHQTCVNVCAKHLHSFGGGLWRVITVRIELNHEGVSPT
jgi:hypothetical protein